MSVLINPQTNISNWKSVGKTLPNPESGVGFDFDTLEMAPPEELSGAAGEKFVASAKPADAATAEHVRSVVAAVERESSRIEAFDGVQGQDAADGRSVTSPPGSSETYNWEPDPLGWTDARQNFSLNDGKGSLYEFTRMSDGTEVFATQSGAAPANFVLFDREEQTYRVFTQTDLQAAEEANSGLLGG